MVRAASVLLALALLVLAIIGFFKADEWLAFADLVAGLCAFVPAMVVRPGDHGKLAVGLPVIFCLSLLIVWLSAYTARATGWLTWLTFGAAIAFGLVAYAARPRPGDVDQRGAIGYGRVP